MDMVIDGSWVASLVSYNHNGVLRHVVECSDAP
jgi:hypothetical protein